MREINLFPEVETSSPASNSRDERFGICNNDASYASIWPPARENNKSVSLKQHKIGKDNYLNTWNQLPKRTKFYLKYTIITTPAQKP